MIVPNKPITKKQIEMARFLAGRSSCFAGPYTCKDCPLENPNGDKCGYYTIGKQAAADWLVFHAEEIFNVELAK